LGVRVVTTTVAAKIRNAKTRSAVLRSAVIRSVAIRTAVIRTVVTMTAHSVDIKRGVTNKNESISMIKKKRRFRAISASVTYRCTVGV